MLNIVIFGAPGSGKGTQSERIVEKFGINHISTGDVLRAEIKKGTELGKTAKGYIDQGQLLPDELIIDILASTLDSFKESKGVIFDGFPRTIAQAEALKGKPNEEMQICSFLWVYYGFPTSCYEGKNVEDVRFVSGLKMGQTDTSEVDCTCGIPDSGVGMALGYAEGKGVPYHRAISKYTPTWPRSFTPSRQEMRSLVAKMKLIPNRAMLEGKRLLFCDDSIVRGTQLRDNVKVLYEYGAKEVHIRIACPPLIYSCPFVGFTASKGDLELITRRVIKELEGDENKNLEKYATTGSPEYEKMVEVIRERFGLSSLKFNTLETLVEAIGLPKCKLCTHCFDGSSHF